MKIFDQLSFNPIQRKIFFSGLICLGAFFPCWFFLHKIILAFLFHLTGIALMTVAIYLRQREMPRVDPWYPVLIHSVIIVFFFPGFGFAMVFVLLSVLLAFGNGLRKGIYDDFEESLQEKQTKGVFANSWTGMLRRVRQDIGFEPIVDILRGTDIELKSMAIQKLAQKATPEAIHLLQAATQDESPEVRLYAASAMLKLETELNEKIRLATKRVSQEGTSKAYAALGDLYLRYAESGLVEASLAHHYLKRASEAYKESIDQETGDPDVVVAYVRCLLNLGQESKVKNFLDHVVKIWPDHKGLNLIRAKVYFNVGEMEKVSTIVGDLTKQKKLSIEELEVIDYWNGSVETA